MKKVVLFSVVMLSTFVFSTSLFAKEEGEPTTQLILDGGMLTALTGDTMFRLDGVTGDFVVTSQKGEKFVGSTGTPSRTTVGMVTSFKEVIWVNDEDVTLQKAGACSDEAETLINAIRTASSACGSANPACASAAVSVGQAYAAFVNCMNQFVDMQ